MVSYTSAWSTLQRQAIIIIIINNVIIITTLKTQKGTEYKYSCIVKAELNNRRSIKQEFKSEWECKVLVRYHVDQCQTSISRSGGGAIIKSKYSNYGHIL
jgi:hypothetical protein